MLLNKGILHWWKREYDRYWKKEINDDENDGGAKHTRMVKSVYLFLEEGLQW